MTTVKALQLLFIIITSLGTLQACPVYLTISLNGKSIEESFVEINWGPDCRNKPEWIGLFPDDPSVSNTQPLAKVDNLQNSTGKFITNVKIGKLRFPRGWNRDDVNTLPAEYPKGKCLNYFVASFNGMELLSVECLKILPNWMGKTQHVADVPLKNLFIPGTHASGAFNYNQKSNLIKDYAFSQHLDVWSQLVFGIRFLDMSIGVNLKKSRTPPEDDNFWVVNENMLVAKLTPILRDVKRFVETSGEIVIMDFSSFPIGFYKRPDRHSDLLRVIEKEIGDLAYKRNTTAESNTKCYELSMNDIRKTGKYLLLIYPIEELPYPDSESDILCPTWKTFSLGDMNTSASLDFMRLLFAKKNDSVIQDEGWIFHAVLGLEQALNTYSKAKTTEQRASVINVKLSSWLGGPWSLTANVVAVDFFTYTNIIDIAIYANLHKAFTFANKNLTRLEIAN